ncbi:unnamed protein product [Cuscuta europaea]|uniref:DUF4283 domain-containing protein n=1 Tax=Cuscuta europaea TaxID=41803 RepID=A0A9P1ELP6_CUSEU|nr:unnamed protein product [Cuscuta europaea]
MVRKKQGSVEPSTVRTTRSRYALLADMDEDLPALSDGTTRKKFVKPGAAANRNSKTEYAGDEYAGDATAGNYSNPGAGQNSLRAARHISKEKGVPNEDERAMIVEKRACMAAMLEPEGTKGAVGQTYDAGQTYVQAEKPAATAMSVERVTKAENALTIPKETGMSKKPWNTLFKDNRDPTHGIKPRFIQPKGSDLDFTNKVMLTMVEMWGHCLVGCFTGRFPGLKAVYELKEKWCVKCLIRPHDKGWVIFIFQNDADRMKVLNDGPYTIFGKMLMLKVLCEDFSFEDEEFLKVPIWVKLPNLPMQLWNEEAMSEVASMSGTPLTTDRITQERANHNFARILIEVDVSKPPPLSFPIRLPSQKIFNQRVVYETFPNFFFHCKKYGHHPFICKELAEKELKEENGKEKNKEVGIINVAAHELTDLEVTAIDNSSLGVATTLEAATTFQTRTLVEPAAKEAAGNVSHAQIEVREVGMEAVAPEVAVIAPEIAAGIDEAPEPTAAPNQNGNKTTWAEPNSEPAEAERAARPPAPKKGPSKKMVFKISKCPGY